MNCFRKQLVDRRENDDPVYLSMRDQNGLRQISDELGRVSADIRLVMFIYGSPKPGYHGSTLTGDGMFMKKGSRNKIRSQCPSIFICMMKRTKVYHGVRIATAAVCADYEAATAPYCVSVARSAVTRRGLLPTKMPVPVSKSRCMIDSSANHPVAQKRPV